MYSLSFSSFFPFIPSSFPFLFSLVALVLANDTSPIGNVFSLTVHLRTDISSQSTSALLLTSSLFASPSPSTLDLFSIFYSHLHFLHLLFLHLLFNLIIISPLAIATRCLLIPTTASPFFHPIVIVLYYFSLSPSLSSLPPTAISIHFTFLFTAFFVWLLNENNCRVKRASERERGAFCLQFIHCVLNILFILIPCTLIVSHIRLNFVRP